MDKTTGSGKRRELGNFVRACREKLSPSVIGVGTGARRRTPGLRREEVAQRAGLSTTWYTWLEQGRDIAPSAPALDRLSTALRMTQAERAYLFNLAGKHDPGRSDTAAGIVPAELGNCVEAISCPAYILDHGWNAQVWNAPATDLFVGWLDASGERERNLLLYIFTSEAAPRLIAEFETRARRIVAEFRADLGTHLGDEAIRTLIAELRGHSPLFATLWDDHSVLEREGGQRRFVHPRKGLVCYHQVTFNLASQPDFKLTMLLDPPDGAASY